MSTDLRTRAWVDVSAPALRRNYLQVRDAVEEGVRIIPMVKADAYGLGMARTIESLEPLDPWGYGVATVEEGLRVRSLGIRKPVAVFSPIPPVSFRDAVEGELAVSVGELGALARLREVAGEVGLPGRFHLEVDTGMGRAGFSWSCVGAWGPAFREMLAPPLRWEGTFTHFHSADGTDETPTRTQFRRLEEVVAALPSMPDGAFLHACNSPGALRVPELGAQGVRPGIFLFGGVAGEGLPAPAPVASLRARVTAVRTVATGSTVGYGATYTASGEEVWATLGIGYGDGLPRLVGNRGFALVGGHRVPIIGRISMDVTVVNVTGLPAVEVGDVATLFGRDGDEVIALEEVAEEAGTINYEILTGLTLRLPRIWTDDDGY